MRFFAALPHPCIIVKQTDEQKKRGRPGNEAKFAYCKQSKRTGRPGNKARGLEE